MGDREKNNQVGGQKNRGKRNCNIEDVGREEGFKSAIEKKVRDSKEGKVDKEMGKGGNKCAHIHPPSTKEVQEKPPTESNKGK